MRIKYISHGGYTHTVTTQPKFAAKAMKLIVACGYYLIEVKGR